MNDSDLQEQILQQTGLKYSELADLLDFSRGHISQIKAGKKAIHGEYKVRCVERLQKPGFRFNIFWFEDPERHPFWVREDYWMNLYPAQVQLLATIRPDFVELLEKASKLTPERREKWLRVVKELFELQDS